MDRVRFTSIGGIIELIREFGVDPAHVSKKAGLSSTALYTYSSDDYVEYNDIERLLQSAADMTGCPYFGALLGTRKDLTMLGLLGHVMQQSPDIQAALVELINHTTMQVPSGAAMQLETAVEYSSMLYQVTGKQPVVTQTNELAISEFNRFMAVLCGSTWSPTEVHFTHKEHGEITPYRRIFGAQVKFNQDESRVIFHSELLKKRISKSNPELREILKTHPDLEKSNANKSLAGRIEQIIRRTLPTGSCTIERTASLLSIHRRTLHRRLQLEGTSFSEILENTRKKIAAERLSNSSITIVQLAQYLGYADNSAFTRSFKRWYGTTPQQWRNKLDG